MILMVSYELLLIYFLLLCVMANIFHIVCIITYKFFLFEVHSVTLVLLKSRILLLFLCFIMLNPELIPS